MPTLTFDGVRVLSRLRRAGVAPAPRLAQAARLAALAKRAAGFAGHALGLELVAPAASARLNRERRRVRGATDVLSFAGLLGARGLPEVGSAAAAAASTASASAAEEGIDDLGDLVVCPAVLARDAARERLDLDAHWRTVLVHGLVHLLGHDHERDDDLAVMEAREEAILKGLAALEAREPDADASGRLRLFLQ